MRILRSRFMETRLAVTLAMQPLAKRSRAFAVSTEEVRTGTPTASTERSADGTMGRITSRSGLIRSSRTSTSAPRHLARAPRPRRPPRPAPRPGGPRTSRRGSAPGTPRPPPRCAASSLALRPVDRNHGDVGPIGQRDQLGAVERDRLARLDGERPPLHLYEGRHRARPYRREVEAGVLRRLAHLDEHDVAARELARAAAGRVGALDALDRDHGAAAHHDALPDVELPDHLGRPEAEADVAPLLRARPPGAQHAGARHDLL